MPTQDKTYTIDEGDEFLEKSQLDLTDDSKNLDSHLNYISSELDVLGGLKRDSDSDLSLIKQVSSRMMVLAKNSDKDVTKLDSQLRKEAKNRIGKVEGSGQGTLPEPATSNLDIADSLLNIFDVISDDFKPNRREGNVEGVSYKEFTILLKNEVFLDYFNKFLVLPNFGTTIFYDKKQKDFSLFPHLNHKHYVVQNKKLKNYLYAKRFLRFLQTPYYLEYRLNLELLSVEYLTSEDQDVRAAFKFLKEKYLQGVSRMRNFRKFLLKSVNNQNTCYQGCYVIFFRPLHTHTFTQIRKS